jgi:hypothetical protein
MNPVEIGYQQKEAREAYTMMGEDWVQGGTI